MHTIPPYIDDLIAKHLAHETTHGEMLELEAWLKEDQTNRSYYDKVEGLFLDQPEGAFELDIENDWQIVKQRIAKPKGGFKRFPWYYPFAAVAALMILGTTGYLFFNKQDTVIAFTPSIILKTANGTITDTLPDGTIVTLNKNSELKTDPDFNKTNRNLELKGEAYFEVAKSLYAPFIIRTDKGEITDIGTAFTVNTRSDTALNISVTEGEIQLKTADKNIFRAKEGQQLIYNPVTQQNRITGVSQNVLAFKTHSFEFNNTSLKELVEQLNATYNQHITYDRVLEDCTITVSFQNEKIETILDIIAETLHVKYGKQKEGFHLAGNKCN